VGIIMDGNGRWAQARGLPRSEGHREGTENAKRVVKAAADLGLRYLSLFVFSTENWKRAEDEVGFLMGLIRKHLSAELDFYRANRIRVLHSGEIGDLPPEVAAEIRRTVADTAAFGGLTVNLAINYGGRDEIARAARRVAAAGGPIDEVSLSAAMDQPSLPDLDLVIRTSDEMRFSNFLLWQAAYAELWFSPKLWPDFGAEDLAEAVEAYRGRARRFGGRP
jgi:undecaprenyl diphosphate synthase